jgi:hypothetical protein
MKESDSNILAHIVEARREVDGPGHRFRWIYLETSPATSVEIGFMSSVNHNQFWRGQAISHYYDPSHCDCAHIEGEWRDDQLDELKLRIVAAWRQSYQDAADRCQQELAEVESWLQWASFSHDY